MQVYNRGQNIREYYFGKAWQQGSGARGGRGARWLLECESVVGRGQPALLWGRLVMWQSTSDPSSGVILIKIVSEIPSCASEWARTTHLFFRHRSYSKDTISNKHYLNNLSSVHIKHNTHVDCSASVGDKGHLYKNIFPTNVIRTHESIIVPPRLKGRTHR